MRKHLFKFISLTIVAAMLVTATPIGNFFDSGIVHADEEEDDEIDMTIKAPGKVGQPSVAKMNKKSYKITWVKVKKNCKGYQIQVSPYKDFVEPEEPEETETLDEDEEEEEIEEIQYFDVTKKKSSQKVTDLTKGRTYYVRVRAYNASDEGYRYGKWSKVKKFKAK